MKKAPSSSSALKQIHLRRSQTLTTIVRDEVFQLIASGALGAGDRINESELATRLGVSRGPVREACRSLEEAGLLVSVVNQGVYVREMTLDDARELYEVRAALSGLMGRLAAARMTDLQVKQLENQLTAMEQAAGARDMPQYYALNLQFHEAIMKMADNDKLSGIYMSVVNQTHLFRRRGMVQQESLQLSNAEHRRIVQALKARDGEQAERALTEHVHRGWERLAQAVQAREALV